MSVGNQGCSSWSPTCGRPNTWRITLANLVTSKAVWLVWDDQRLSLRIPVQFLNENEYRRVTKLFGSEQAPSSQDGVHPWVPDVPYFEQAFESSVDTAVANTLATFQRVFFLSPQCQLELSYVDGHRSIGPVDDNRPIEQLAGQFRDSDGHRDQRTGPAAAHNNEASAEALAVG